jgi:DNA-3-methyladenine glycosylase I
MATKTDQEEEKRCSFITANSGKEKEKKWSWPNVCYVPVVKFGENNFELEWDIVWLCSKLPMFLCLDPIYVAYHDEEWGVPVHDDK